MSLDTDDEQIDIELDTEESGDEAETGAEENSQVEAEEEDLTFEVDGYGDEEEANDTPTMKRLRDQLREAQRENHRLKTAAPQKVEKIEVGKKPDLWDDCEGDSDKYEAALSEWIDRKRKADAVEKEQTEAQEKAQADFARAESNLRVRAEKIGIRDFDKVRETVAERLGPVGAAAFPVLASIPKLGDNMPGLMAVLGRNDKLMAEVAALEPYQQIFRLGQLSMGVKEVRRNGPAPERGTIIQGSAAVGATGDKHLEALEKKAQKTGNWDEYFAAKRQAKR